MSLGLVSKYSSLVKNGQIDYELMDIFSTFIHKQPISPDSGIQEDMAKFIYEIHKVVTNKEGPFEIESETWIEARQEIHKNLSKAKSENYTIKLLHKADIL